MIKFVYTEKSEIIPAIFIKMLQKRINHTANVACKKSKNLNF